MFYFLVYNDNTHTVFIKRLLQSVRTFGKCFHIIIFNKEDMDEEFQRKYKKTLQCKRGGGYWLWKPYIILETMKKLYNNDIVFYMDSKYYFTQDFTNLYFDYMKTHDMMVWKNKPNDKIWHMKNWCKMDVIQKYHIHDLVFTQQAEDCWAGALIFKKSANTLQYLQEWLTMCCVYEDISDEPSKHPNQKEFREHRHDQSLLSIVIYKYSIPLCYFERKYLQNVRDPFPFP